MNGFRIVTAADNALHLHCKCRVPRWTKAALILAVPLLLLIPAGCKKTPSYSGPPNLVLTVLMKKWAIVPDRIVVPQGAHVELIVSSADVEHGFNVPALAINEPVQPGRAPAMIRFLAQTPGTYPMRCSIACGKGHDKMTGVIIITPDRGAAPAAAH